MASRAFLVARREYLENLRTQAFWIGIFIFPVLITMAIAVPIWLERTRSAQPYAVLDRSGWLAAAVEAKAAEADIARALRAAVERQRRGGPDWERLPEPLRQAAALLAAEAPAAAERAGSRQAGAGLGSTGGEAAREALARLANGVGAGEAGDGLGVAGVGESTGGGEPAGEALAGLAAEAGALVLAPASEAPAAGVDAARARRRAVAGSLASWWQALSSEQAARLEAGLSKERFQRVEVAGGQGSIEELNRQAAAEELLGYFVIDADPVAARQPGRYVSARLADDDLHDWFTERAGEAIRERRFATLGIDREVASSIQAPVRFELKKVGKAGTEEEVSRADRLRQYSPMAFVYLLWVAVFSTSQMLLTNTIEEKSNRIMEVLLSSVSPLQLMVGKIAGIAATGLTVVGSWVLFFLAAARLIPAAMGGGDVGLDLASVAGDPILLGSFVAYFFLGYLLFSALLVGIGAVCNSLKEAQNLMGPVTLLMIAPLLAMTFINKDPNGALAKVMSFIPPFTPFVMMNRAAGPPSLAEYVLTTLLLLASIAAAFWGAAKVFRIGILMTGKPPRPAEVLRWLKAPVGQVPVRRTEEPAA
jgi:ABC-type Na+ efflux pump permease subunit